MKKILTFLFILIGLFGVAQTPYPTPNNQGSPNTRIQNKGGYGVDSTFVPPVYADTFLANRSRTSLYAGAVIRVGDAYYYRNSTATGWLLFGVSTSNCHGTDLVSGSVSWSGTGLVYDATDLDYYILCTRYSASATTLTLQAADPTYDRIDVFYADVNGNIGIITGTPATNPQQPSVDPLTQINLGFVYVPAGSLVPQCTTATTVYNENVEWTGASNVSGINFAYATNPYSGVVSTYIPNAVDGQYVSYQNGTVLDITDYQFLKFYIRLNAASATDPSNFLTISFFNGASQSTQDFYVGTGTYGFDGGIIGSYQLVVIPVYNIVFSSSSFDKVNIYINGAPTSFQVDKMYLLSCASTPPTQGTAWVLGGNYTNGVRPNTIGTKDKSDFPIITTDVVRMVISQDGITESSDTTHKVLLWDSTSHRVYWTYQPTIRDLFPLVVVDSSNGFKYNRVDTADANPTSLATQYDLSQISGGSGWLLTGNAGTTAGTNFIGTTDNVDFVVKRNNLISGRLGNNTIWGYAGLQGLTSGTGNIAIGSSLGSLSTNNGNIGIGNSALASSEADGNIGIGQDAGLNISTGQSNTVIGHLALPAIGGGITGSRNTIIGAGATLASSSTRSSISLGYNASAASNQFAISDSITQIKATGITGATTNGYVLTTDGTGVATFQAAGGGSSLFPLAGGSTTATGTTNANLNGNALTLSGGAYSLRNDDMWIDNSSSGVILIGDAIDQHSTIQLNKNVGSKDIIFSTSTLERVRIDSNGRVGIGTTTPSEKLDVNGDINAADTLKEGGNPIPFIQGGAYLSAVNREPTNTISSTGFNSTIAAGSGNTMDGNNSFIAAEQTTITSDCEAVAVIGGSTHYVSNTTDTYIGGTGNSAFDTRSTFIFGIGNETSNSSGGALLGGSSNRLFGNIGTVETDNAILGGKNNTIDSSSNNSIIIGGQTNSIDTGSINSAIIGGITNNIPSGLDNVIILGMTSNITATSSRTTYVDSLNVSGKVTGSLAGGTGLPISTGVSGLGTGIATALAVNVGTAGAPVVNGGALGTPSSGTMTNVSGTAASLTAGNATTLATARNINGSSFNGSADISTDIKTRAYQALGSTILAQNVDGDLANGVSGAAMNSQRIYYTAVYLPLAATITGVKWIQITAGDYTANNYNGVALFTYSGGTLTKVASSTDDGNIWKATTGTMASKAFSATYSAAAGLYFIGHMYSSSAQVTAPSLGIIGSASTVNTVTDFTNSAKTSALITGQTALPASTQAMSGLTAAATEYKVYLY